MSAPFVDTIDSMVRDLRAEGWASLGNGQWRAPDGLTLPFEAAWSRARRDHEKEQKRRAEDPFYFVEEVPVETSRGSRFAVSSHAPNVAADGRSGKCR